MKPRDLSASLTDPAFHWAPSHLLQCNICTNPSTQHNSDSSIPLAPQFFQCDFSFWWRGREAVKRTIHFTSRVTHRFMYLFIIHYLFICLLIYLINYFIDPFVYPALFKITRLDKIVCEILYLLIFLSTVPLLLSPILSCCVNFSYHRFLHSC